MKLSNTVCLFVISLFTFSAFADVVDVMATCGRKERRSPYDICDSITQVPATLTEMGVVLPGIYANADDVKITSVLRKPIDEGDHDSDILNVPMTDYNGACYSTRGAFSKTLWNTALETKRRLIDALNDAGTVMSAGYTIQIAFVNFGVVEGTTIPAYTYNSNFLTDNGTPAAVRFALISEYQEIEFVATVRGQAPAKGKITRIVTWVAGPAKVVNTKTGAVLARLDRPNFGLSLAVIANFVAPQSGARTQKK